MFIDVEMFEIIINLFVREYCLNINFGSDVMLGIEKKYEKKYFFRSRDCG